VLVALRTLAEDPRSSGSEKLHDTIYRIRVGEWRVIYAVDDANHVVNVEGIRRRSEDTYKGIEELFG
jgi:mRNA interferase RelE/StbE